MAVFAIIAFLDMLLESRGGYLMPLTGGGDEAFALGGVLFPSMRVVIP